MSHSLLFAGSDRIALPTLERLSNHGWITAVLSVPSRSHGRSGRNARNGTGGTETAVSEYARAHTLPLLTYEKLDQTACNEVARLKCNGLICVAYGKYFPSSFLSLFPAPTNDRMRFSELTDARSYPIGTMNLHPSLLPRFRGPSPIVATLLSDDRYGGVSIIRIAKEMDGGEILAQERVAINANTTREELERWCATQGALMIERLLFEYAGLSDHDTRLQSAKNIPDLEPQDESKAVWCRKITRDHGRIEWSLPATMLMRQLNAFQRWPNSFTMFRDKRLIIHQACVIDTETKASRKECGVVAEINAELGGICIQTGTGIIAVQQLQLEYKQAIDWQSFVNGYRITCGERFV